MNDWYCDAGDPDGLGGDLGGLPGAGELTELLAAAGPDAADSDGHLLLDLGGRTYGLPTDLDEGELGVGSVTLADDNGMTICADTDGDGTVDYLSVVGFDGSWSAWRRLASVVGDIPDAAGDPPPATPGRPTDNWNTYGWMCVERGDWG